MGADFVALIPSESGGMSYSYVHVIRYKLVSMVDKGLGELLNRANWTSTSGMVWDIVDSNYQKVNAGLKEIYNATGDDVVAGVMAFINHSDCDGWFGDEECEDILKALKKLAETDDDDAVENLIKVFDDAVNGNGIVAIW